MARETKAQRLAREEAQALQALRVKVETYRDRLMVMLERATKVNFTLEVKDAKFLLKDRDQSRDRVFELTLTFSDENEETLWDLDWQVEAKENEQREAQRRLEAKTAALAKLTKEERELLNL